MANIRVVQYKQRLDHLFDQVKAFKNNTELQAQWARYLCVLVAGFTETSIQEILGEYARDRAAPNVANYVYVRLRRFTNPKMEDILVLLGSFEPEWRHSTEIVAEEKLKDAVDSVMGLRNLIAHGVDTGVSYIRIKEYYQSILKLIEHIEAICV